MKFRKKPVVIEAEQYLGSYTGAYIPAGVYLELVGEVESPRAYVRTLEGKLEVLPGDWVITGIAGEKYPCKPDIFEKTYERVEE